MCHYSDGDHVFLFGFSRGAFTVRALAGMLHFCGLIRLEDQHLLPYATGPYLSAETENTEKTNNEQETQGRACNDQ
jgi:uncharacterized protein (DUF2235 family)